MAVGCEEILAYAENSLPSVQCEVGARTVIGRAYYACYHRVGQFHQSLDSQGEECPAVDKRHPGMHAKLIYALQHPTVADAQKAGASRHLGRLAKSLYDKRKVADYKIEATVEKRVAAQVVGEARRLFTFMDQNGL